MAEEGTKTAEQGEETEVPEEKEAPKTAEELEKTDAPPAEAPPLETEAPPLETPVKPPEESPERKDEPPPEPPAEKEPPKEVKLDAAAGSAVHLAQLNLLNMNSGVKQIQLELAAAEGRVRHLREKLQWEGGKLNTERNNVLAVLSKSGVPDGWRFKRHDDGSYTFMPPTPAPPPG